MFRSASGRLARNRGLSRGGNPATRLPNENLQVQAMSLVYQMTARSVVPFVVTAHPCDGQKPAVRSYSTANHGKLSAGLLPLVRAKWSAMRGSEPALSISPRWSGFWMHGHLQYPEQLRC